MKMGIDTLRLHTGSYTSIMRGRWTATLPEPEESSTGVESDGSDEGLVMFVLGAQINQSAPLGVSWMLHSGKFVRLSF